MRWAAALIGLAARAGPRANGHPASSIRDQLGPISGQFVPITPELVGRSRSGFGCAKRPATRGLPAKGRVCALSGFPDAPWLATGRVRHGKGSSLLVVFGWTR